MSKDANGVIVPPIGLAEIYTELGISSTGGCYDVVEACLRGSQERVNPWSKHKPMDINTPAELTEEQFRQNMYGLCLWDSGEERFTIQPLELNAQNLQNQDNLMWASRTPTTWARLTDYNGYYHKAMPFMYFRRPSDGVRINVNSGAKGWTMPTYTNFFSELADRMITVEDLIECWGFGSSDFGSDYIPAAAVVSGSGYRVFDAGTSVSDEQGENEIILRFDKSEGTSSLGPGTYRVYPILYRGDEFIPMPCVGSNGFVSSNGTPFSVMVVNDAGSDDTAHFRITVDRIGAANFDTSMLTDDVREGSSHTKGWQDAFYYDWDGDGNPLHVYNYSNVVFKCTVRNLSSQYPSEIDRARFSVSVSGSTNGKGCGTQLQTESKFQPWGQGGKLTVAKGGTATIYVVMTAQRMLYAGEGINGPNTNNEVAVLYSGSVVGSFEFAEIISDL